MFNSLFLIHPPDEPLPILLMFLFTRDSAENGVNEACLREISRLRFPRGTHIYYVVTSDDVRPISKSPRRIFRSRLSLNQDSDDAFLVFHYPVSEDVLFPCQAK
jgi:hypothetical protein